MARASRTIQTEEEVDAEAEAEAEAEGAEVKGIDM